MKKIVLMLLLLCLILPGCQKKGASDGQSEEGSSAAEPVSVDENQETAAVSGETIAIMTIKDYGDIKIKFFPDSAPKAVENFQTLASSGYYDGLIFHRVIDEFMIQGGDPTGTGYYGESCWGEAFEDEFSNLVPIRGALCMANSGANTNGSQFFFVQAHESYKDYLDQFGLSDEQKELFINYGGTPWLYKAHTVFGQVYEGMDVIDTIAKVQTDGNDKPRQDVIIEHIEITTAP